MGEDLKESSPVAPQLESARRIPRIAIYPEVNQDGIGSYIQGIKGLLGVATIPYSGNILSPGQFFHKLPQGFDLIHIPHSLVPFSRRRVKIVCTIQDIIPVVAHGHLGYFKEKYLRFRIAWSLRKADHLIFTSQSTLNDVRRVFGAIGSFSVIPLAMEPPLPTDGIPESMYPFPYYFCVGRRRGHKNVEGILRAFAKVASHTQSHLIFGGKEDIHDTQWKVLAERLGIAARIHFTGFLSKEQLAGHYRHAVCLVFPSLYEGFGLPILEAMSYGCPVITSDMSSMPEVAGGAALLVDPRDVDAIVLAMTRLAEDLNLRSVLKAKGFENCRRFSWEKTARETAAVYQKTLNTA